MMMCCDPYLEELHDSIRLDGLVGSIAREDSHMYSMAVSGDMLYTGSEGRNIGVWKNLKKISLVKTGGGLVKTIVICDGRMFTGHVDGKVRIWRMSRKDTGFRKRMGSLPSVGDCLKSLIDPRSYMTNRGTLRVRHFDAVSCLSLCVDDGILYSSSWDKSFKVWRIADSKCMESIEAHDDAINCIIAGFCDMVLTGSADGTLKVWRRQKEWRRRKRNKDKEKTRHCLLQLLLKHNGAVTTVAVDEMTQIVYSGSSEGGVNFWEKGREFKYRGMLEGHRSPVLCLTVSSRLVFSGSADTTICVWKKVGTEHMRLAVLRGHVSPVKCLAVEEKEERKIYVNRKRWRVFSGGFDGSLKVWQLSQVTNRFKI